ncbi:MAG: deoxyribodipyrimidine photo-lyase [Phycisphaeraceae bacterium]|nr:deoxyribodipyrimidine photo-lyase [Phycisphaerales bacterium]MCB9859055.1 deoxyribodipyrimidine photo-lyase [Phycisphaeraceae bacterium]
MRPLVWMRTDLRTHDNPALHHACKASSRGVVAVFTICPKQWLSHDMAPIKAAFILRNLKDLSETLAKKNIALKIIETPTFATVPKLLKKLANEHECDALYFNREYEVNEQERDEEVTKVFESAGISIHAFTDQCVFAPGEVLTGKGDPYTVFTPFKKSWCAAVDEDRDRIELLSAPRKLAEMVSTPDDIPASIKGFSIADPREDLWHAGEKHAISRLNAFIENRLRSYKDARDVPAINGTSTISPYLASGVVSLRTCVHAAVQANNGKLDTGNIGATTWISELVWREFYKHILFHFPRVCKHRAFKVETERLRWNDNNEHFAAWCEGRTGFPIVDAAMRQLVQTGWMHNRLRMIVAMFLSKNLFLDWRLGERFFMRHLIDGDLAPNNGGWQWSASTGTDAAPYFRIFNTVTQSKKFDPDGSFIRKFVPELKDVDNDAIHDPSTLPELARANLDYPQPIVDLKQTRERAIEAFRELK